ncbi:MAG: PIN domain-containing protein [Gaiellales bacterium]
MIVLDASAALAALQGEAGAVAVDALFETQSCAMSAVNMSEVTARLFAHGATIRQARSIVGSLPIRVLPFDEYTGELTAALLAPTKPYGLSIADRACIATGVQYDAPVFTMDRAWASVDVAAVVITVLDRL